MASLRTTINDEAADAVVILDLGTYWAQRAADDSLGLHTAAYRCEIKDLGSLVFLQVKSPNLRFRGVGRVGIEPTTGGL
jgi:hypothetical protein